MVLLRPNIAAALLLLILLSSSSSSSSLISAQPQPPLEQSTTTLRKGRRRYLQPAVVTTTTLRLIDVRTKTVVADLLDGARIDVTGRGPFTIQAVVVSTTTRTTTGSVVFGYQANPIPFRIESFAPYAFCGDIAGNYTACNQFNAINIPHTVSATPYSLAGGKGMTIGPTRTVTFTLTRGGATTPTTIVRPPAPVPVAARPPTRAPIVVAVPKPAPVPVAARPPTTRAPIVPPPMSSPVVAPVVVAPPTTGCKVPKVSPVLACVCVWTHGRPLCDVIYTSSRFPQSSSHPTNGHSNLYT